MLFCHLCITFSERSVHGFVHFRIESFFFLTGECESSLYILDSSNPLSNVKFVNIFDWFECCLVNPLEMDLCRTNVLNFDETYFIYIFFMDPVFGVRSKSTLSCIKSRIFCGMFLSLSFTVFYFI